MNSLLLKKSLQLFPVVGSKLKKQHTTTIRVPLLLKMLTSTITTTSTSKSKKGNNSDSEARIETILARHDSTQRSLLDEQCILVDPSDTNIGSASKRECHSLHNIEKEEEGDNPKGHQALHRAFSVFLFDTSGKLMLQQRSHEKITYPDHWTNACCSHPLNIPGEMDSWEVDSNAVKRAARRRLNYELGLAESELADLSLLHFLTRIQYKARNVPDDGCFGEHEIDYVLFLKGDFRLKPNKNEVKAIKYVNRAELAQMMAKKPDNSYLVTPWFGLIYEKFLSNWWNNLHDLKSLQEVSKIHRL